MWIVVCTLNIDLPAITCNSMSTDFCKDMTVCLYIYIYIYIYIFEASEIMASLPLNTVQCLYENTKSGFVPIIVLMPPSRLPILQNNRTIC